MDSLIQGLEQNSSRVSSGEAVKLAVLEVFAESIVREDDLLL